MEVIMNDITLYMLKVIKENPDKNLIVIKNSDKKTKPKLVLIKRKFLEENNNSNVEFLGMKVNTKWGISEFFTPYINVYGDIDIEKESTYFCIEYNVTVVQDLTDVEILSEFLDITRFKDFFSFTN